MGMSVCLSLVIGQVYIPFCSAFFITFLASGDILLTVSKKLFGTGVQAIGYDELVWTVWSYESSGDSAAVMLNMRDDVSTVHITVSIGLHCLSLLSRLITD